MNDLELPLSFANGCSQSDERADDPPNDAIPQFGAVDIVEAFTAMRHEWRGQTRESLALAERIQAAVNRLQSLETTLIRQAAESHPEEAGLSRQLVLLIAETDHLLTRAIDAIAQWEASRTERASADANAVDRYFAGMSRIGRRFARPLLDFIAEQRRAAEHAGENPAIEGLSLVLARLRRAMRERDIERIDTMGQPFDAGRMNAIGTVATEACPSGHVAEQISPAYRWQGQVVRFADVRVAKND